MTTSLVTVVERAKGVKQDRRIYTKALVVPLSGFTKRCSNFVDIGNGDDYGTSLMWESPEGVVIQSLGCVWHLLPLTFPDLPHERPHGHRLSNHRFDFHLYIGEISLII